MKPKKILVINELFPPAIGGTANVCFHHCNAMHENGYDVTVICSYHEGAEAEDYKLPYKIKRLKSWYNFKKSPLWQKPSTNRILRVILMIQFFFICLFHSYEALWLVSFDQTNAFFPFLKKIKTFRFILSVYGEDLRMYSKTPRSKNIMMKIFSCADKITVLCNYWKQCLMKFGVAQKKIEIMPIPVDLSKFNTKTSKDKAREFCGIDKDIPVLLTLGRVVPRKGMDMVIKCMPDLLKAFPDLLYLVVGDGYYLEELKQLAQSLSVDKHVRFMSEVKNPELHFYYQAADVFAHPNREIRETGEIEGFGIVFIEANACGLPVVAGNSGGSPDAVLEGKTGFIVDPENATDITGKIKILFTDKELAAVMRKNALEWCKNFSIEATSEIVNNIVSKP